MTGEKPSPKYPAFNSRVIASAVDLAILTVFVLPVTDWLVGLMFAPLDVNGIISAYGVNSKAMPDYQAIGDILKKSLPQIIATNLLELCCMALYILPFWFRFSATPGKMLLRMEIRDYKSLERMTRKQAVIRFIGYLISGLPLSLGFIWVMFNKKRRGWHDYVAGTIVIKKPKV